MTKSWSKWSSFHEQFLCFPSKFSMLMCICRPPSQNKQYFLEKLSEIIDHFPSIYDNHINVNMEPSNSVLKIFMQSHNLFNLIKSNTCFKWRGSCIDLILTNRKFCFKNSSTFEAGLSDHHHLTYSMLKTTFKKVDSKRLIYSDDKNFNHEYFQNDLKNGLSKWPKNYESCGNVFVTVLDRHAPKKTKDTTQNQKPHVDKNLRNAIMKCVPSWNLRKIEKNDQKIFQITKSNEIL